MVKKVTYKEPKGYFNDEMLKAAKEWDKAHPEAVKAREAEEKRISAAKKGKK